MVENALEKQRDQLPLLVPIGLGLGIIIWQIGGDGFWPILACFLGGWALFALRLGTHFRAARLMLWFSLLVGTGFASIAIKSWWVGGDRLQRPVITTLYARVETVENVSARGIVRYVLKTSNATDLPRHVRVNVPIEKHIPAIGAGAIIQMKARIMPPAGPALPSSYDFARFAWFQGIGATGSALSAPILITPPRGGQGFWSASREAVAHHIRSSMSPETGGIGAALLVGTRGAISQDDAEALRNSGMAHLLSVSGLHVTAIVGGAFFLISRILALSPWFALRHRVPIVAAGGAAVIAVGYTLLTGAEVPTVRACVAALLILIALAMGREALSLRLLATGACLVLLFWPEALAGPSFQLSFAAVATIVLLHESHFVKRLTERRDEPMTHRFGRFVFSLLLTGLAIELVLAPIALFHFHKSGVYGALANILAIPLTTFFVMPTQIVALAMDRLGLGEPFWWLAGQGVSAIRMLAYAVSDAPGSVLMLPSMPRWAFGFTVLGGLWFAIWKGQIRYYGIAPLAIGVVAMLLAPRPDLLVTGDGRHVALVNPQGQLIMLRSRTGEYAMSQISENAAVNAEPILMDDWRGAKCSPDMCVFNVLTSERNWTILAARTPYLIPSMELAAACKRADIVISERYLPWSCKPRWIKADREFLEQHGGLAFYFSREHVDTVARTTAHQPWSILGKTERAPKRPFVSKNESPSSSTAQ
jgi:competence protein ComEC